MRPRENVTDFAQPGVLYADILGDLRTIKAKFGGQDFENGATKRSSGT